MVSFTCRGRSGLPIPTPLGHTFRAVGKGFEISDAAFSANPHSLGLMPVCWRKEG